MNSTLLLLVLAIGCAVSADATSLSRRKLRQLSSIEEAVSTGVKNNAIGTLTRLGTATEVVGTNVSRAAALLIRTILREGFNLGGVAAYVPRLLFLDGPNQFIETLRLIRTNQIRTPNDMNSAIDNLITFTGSVRDSGITGKLSPIVEFFPNIFTGVEKFVQDLVYNAFAWVGPLPSPAKFDNVIKEQAYRAVSSTLGPI